MNMNTNIWTVICEYKYEYQYLSHTKPKINMLLYKKKAVKVRKNYSYMCHSMQSYGIWLNLCRLIQIQIYSVSMSKTNTNTNIFGLIKEGEYEYEYIWGDNKGRIRI